MSLNSTHNLPEQPNALLGRDQELQAARELLLSPEVPLISLLGPPGVGKTRLAIAVAESVLESFPEGVRFVDLAPLHDPALVGTEIASTFGITERRAETALDSLAACLSGRRVLLYLDNFEGVLPAAAWVGRLIERTPGLKILTTSRERLRLRWERTLLVPPLPLPDLGLPPDVSALAANPSVALFVQRATAVDAEFNLSPKNAPVIATLCTRLDGLPLAIELAAARADVLSPAEILANMDNRFRLLGMGALDLPARHQTLKAAIDWSYESLPPAESRFLRQLAVFSGGFSIAAAERVGECGNLGLDGLETLIALVEKSLLIRTQGPADETRFTLLESIRAYLLDRLRASGELDRARRRHAEYYLELAERNYAERKKLNRNPWLDRLEIEHDDLRAALQWSLDTGEYTVGQRIAAALWLPFWWLYGHIGEGVRWLELFLARGEDARDETYLRILEGAGTLRGWQGDFERGRALLTQALHSAEERQDRANILRILGQLGWIFWANGKTKDAAWLEERMQDHVRDGDPWDRAYAFLSLASLLYEADQDEAAEKEFARCLGYFQLAEEKSGSIFAASKLALLKQRKGELAAAKQGMLGALEAARQLNDLHITAPCVDDAAELAADQAAAQNVIPESDLEKIARVLGAVDRAREILSLPRSPRDKSAYVRTAESLQQRMGESSYLRAWDEGRSTLTEAALQEATQLLETSTPQAPKDTRWPEGERFVVALSRREEQVLGWVAEGLSNQEIAEHLAITERTVRFHLTSIFNKLGADNRAQAVSIASRRGLL